MKSSSDPMAIEILDHTKSVSPRPPFHCPTQVAQSSTRVSTFMRNIDASVWMDNPQLQVVETAVNSPTGGSSFTLFADTVGVNLEDGGQSTVKKVAAK